MEPENSELYRFLAQNGVGSYGYPANSEFPIMQSLSSSSTYYPLEMSGVTSTETTPQDKALAALNNHKEAEKRRRERINSHLNRLRSLLPCNSKVHIHIIFSKPLEKWIFNNYWKNIFFWMVCVNSFSWKNKAKNRLSYRVKSFEPLSCISKLWILFFPERWILCLSL